MRTSRRRRHTVLAVGASVAAAVALTVLVVEPWNGSPEESAVATAPAPEPVAPVDPMQLALPTGDRLTVVEGSRFELLSVTDAERRVSLSSGAMIFDVAPVGDGSRFEVVTDDLTVRVMGTVFGVHTGASGTTVRVYEGRVEVLRDGLVRQLDAGEALGTGESLQDDVRLTAAGERAADARAELQMAREADGAPLVEEDLEEVRPVPTAPIASADDITAHAPSSTAEQARDLIAAGDAGGALAAARLALAAHPRDVAFRLVEADALRALRRYAEAADAYDQAADGAPFGERQGAGYRAAAIRRTNLGDPAGALRSLDSARVDAEGSPFEERGLALRARALTSLDRADEARAVAERYLSAFPTGSTRQLMERLVAASES